MLTEGFDHIEERPFTCGGFADVYRATYKGQPVVAKALKTTSMDNLENVHKVGGVIFRTIARYAYGTFSALCEGGRRVEMASTREHPPVRRGYIGTTILFHGLGLDGEWRYYEISQEQSETESVQSCRYISSRIWQH